MLTNNVSTFLVDREIVKRLFKRFSAFYGQLWTSRASSINDWEYVIDTFLEALSEFSVGTLAIAVKESLEKYKDYPPSLSNLVFLCLKADGLPDKDLVLHKMIRKEFDHPIIKTCYQKIGSWTLSHGKQDEVKKKINEFYDQALIDFRIDPKGSWDKLEFFNNSFSNQSLPPPKNLNDEEKKNIRGILEKVTEISKKRREANGSHPTWEKSLIERRSKKFDQNIFYKRKEYLMNLDEYEAATLDSYDWYDRIRYLRQKEGDEIINRNKNEYNLDDDKKT